MSLNLDATGFRTTAAALAAACALTLALAAPRANAQTKPDEPKQEGSAPCPARPAPPPAAPESVETIFLTNASQPMDLNDIQTDVRNVLPRARIYGVQSQNAITLKGTAEDLETARKLIAELDRPRKLYRLTYTITDVDSGKRSGSQHYVVLAASAQRSVFKLGNRVPIVTGSKEGDAKSSQMQYVDVGLSIEATLSGTPDGLTLRTKVEQSSLADVKITPGPQDPTIRQTVLDETAELVQGKPMVLGSLDVPGTTRRQEVEVLAEVVK